MPEPQALGLLQPAVCDIKGGCTRSPLAQHRRQSTWRWDKAEDSQDKIALASRVSSRANIEDVTRVDENVQNPNATRLARTQTAGWREK